MSTKSERKIDEIVGKNIRYHRMRLGYSQENLGEILGVTFQQVQKFEKGVNRVGAGRLFLIAQHFDVPIQNFFDGAGGATQSTAPAASDLLTDKTTFRVANTFSTLPRGPLRDSIADIIQQIAKHCGPHER